MVKEFELDPLADVWIFVDAARSVQTVRPYQRPEFDPRDFWRRKVKFDLPPSTLEYAVTSAASLARYYLQRERAVGLAYADQGLRVLPSDRGGRQLGKILEALSLVQSDGDLPLQSIIESQARHLTRGSTVILITSSTSENVARTIDLIVRRGLRPVAVLIDAQSFGGYFSAQRVAVTLEAMKVPYCIVKEGDDLGAALTTSVSSPNWS
jgi:uncharacterized protein (DUF58 family)